MRSARLPLVQSNPSEFEALLSGDRAALARAITRIENERPGANELWRAARERCGRAQIIGITGAPGAGKSTLIAALLQEYLGRGRRVAVLAFDPSSPITGGALLGDRVRMGELASDAAFIRSVSARGHLGGLSRTAGQIIDLFDAAGFDPIIVETVGTGQSEVEIAAYADTRVVICPPGLGDEVQAIKAGVLEIADLLVVSKADLPAAQRSLLDLRIHFAGRRQGEWAVEVLPVAATRGEGVRALADALETHAATVGRGRRLLAGRPTRAGQRAAGVALVLVGATRLACSLARIAVAAGIEVQILEPRLPPARLPRISGARVSSEAPGAVLAQSHSGARLVVAVCTRDRQLLAAAVEAALGVKPHAIFVPSSRLSETTQAAQRAGAASGVSLRALPRSRGGYSRDEEALLMLAAIIDAQTGGASPESAR